MERDLPHLSSLTKLFLVAGFAIDFCAAVRMKVFSGLRWMVGGVRLSCLPKRELEGSLIFQRFQERLRVDCHSMIGVEG